MLAHWPSCALSLPAPGAGVHRKFTESERGCLVHFDVNFRVRSHLHAQARSPPAPKLLARRNFADGWVSQAGSLWQVLAGIFQTVADSQMAAFENRCRHIAETSGVQLPLCQARRPRSRC